MQIQASARIKWDRFFYLALALFVFLETVQSSLLPIVMPSFSPICWKLYHVFRALFIFEAFREKISLTIGRIALLLVVALTFLSTNSWAFFDLFFIGIFIHKKSYTQILRWSFFSLLASVAFVVALFYLGVLPQYDIMRSDGTMRIAFGFQHPNTFGRLIMILCMMYCTMRRSAMTWWESLAMLAIAFFIYKYPNSVTSTLLIALIAMIPQLEKLYQWLFKRKLVNNKGFRILSYASVFVLIAALALILMIYMDHREVIDDFPATLQARIKLAKYALSQYPLNLTGHSIEFATTFNMMTNPKAGRYFVIDCFYYYLPIRFGLIATVYFWIVFLRRMIRSGKEKDIYKFMNCLILLIYSISESALLSSLSIVFVFVFYDTSLVECYVRDLMPHFKKLKIKWR